MIRAHVASLLRRRRPTTVDAPDSHANQRWWVVEASDLLRWFDAWPMLRQLAIERWFRWTLTMVTLAVVALAFSVPRVWIVTPRGCTPEIRVSGLDLLQAVHHRRRSEAMWRAGDVESSIFEWRQSLACHPASVGALRSGLERLASSPARDPGRFRLAVGNALWLLQLTRTNRADLDLALRVYDAYGVDDLLRASLDGIRERSTVVEYALGLKSRFRTGDITGFHSDWRGLTGRPEVDGELEVYQAAVASGWGQGADVQRAEQRLDLARRHPSTRVAALRAALMIEAHRGAVARYSQTLSELEEVHEASPTHHVAYWRLLVSQGRRGEARNLAARFAGRPATAVETRRMAEAFLELGLEDDALRLLERFVPEHGITPELWQFHAHVLLHLGRWEDLRLVAIAMRFHSQARGALAGFSHFLDGLYHRHRGDRVAEASAFATSSELPIRDPRLVQDVAAELVRMGHASVARRLLLGRERDLGHRAEYWSLLGRSAVLDGDVENLERAARRCWSLQPDDAGAMNSLAAALLVRRRDPALILYLTRRVLDANPDSLPARLNRASALILAGRLRESRAWLLVIGDPAALPPMERSLVELAWAELRVAEGDAKGAFAELRRVGTEYLMEPQRDRVAALNRELELQLHTAR